MFNQNTQDQIQQTLFTNATMNLKPTMAPGAISRQSGMRPVQMAVAKPSLSGNFGGQNMQVPAASVSRGQTISMSVNSNQGSQIQPQMFQTRHYLEGTHMNLNQQNQYPQENFMKANADAFKSASMNTNMSAANKNVPQPMKQEQVNQAMSSFSDKQIQETKPIETVAFEIQGDEEGPVVMENHFEGTETRKEGESLVQNSVRSTYGTVNNFMYNYFYKVKELCLKSQSSWLCLPCPLSCQFQPSPPPKP